MAGSPIMAPLPSQFSQLGVGSWSSYYRSLGGEFSRLRNSFRAIIWPKQIGTKREKKWYDYGTKLVRKWYAIF